MNAPLLRTAGVLTSNGFSSFALRRACISHRAARLATCAAVSSRNHREPSGRQYATSSKEKSSPPEPEDNSDPLPSVHSQEPSINNPNVRSHEAVPELSFEDSLPRTGSREPLIADSNELVSELSLKDSLDALPPAPGAELPIVNPTVKSYNPVHELDPYLPLELRSKSWAENLVGFEGVRNPATLPAVILRIQEQYSGQESHRFPAGVLTHIALEQQRWPAYMSLAEALLKSKKRPPNLGAFLQSSPWSSVDTTFPGLNGFNNHVVFDPESFQSPAGLVVTRSSIENLVDSQELSGSADKQAIGQLWRSLGSIVLASMRESEEYAAYMMSHVHRVLAMMHHEERMHPSIYDFDSEMGFDIARKPAFLHIMSSRFMGVVADAMWKIDAKRTFSWYNLMVAADEKTTGPKLLDSEPPVPPIEPQAWLELILWSCIHGNHADAAMGIIEEMTLEEADGLSWSTMAWPTMLASARGSTESEQRRFEQRFSRVSGDSITDEVPIVTLPPRTISREVVSAAIQLSTSIPVHGGAQNLIEFVPGLLRNLLPPTREFSMEQFWVSIVNRLLSLADQTAESQPTMLDSIGKLMKAVNNVAASQDLGLTGENAGPQLDSGTPVTSIHHRAMANFLSLGNTDGALQAYIRLERWLRRQVAGLERESEQAEKAITKKIRPTNRQTLQPTAEENVLQEKRKQDLQEGIEALSPVLPNGTLATFVDLIVKHKRPELGKRILAATSTDDNIPEACYQSELLQPVIIRLGIALGDHQMIQEVAQHLDSKEVVRRPELLHSLLFAQVAFRKFKPAASLLRLMRETKIEMSDEAVMIIAQAILELEHAGDGAHNQRQLTQACNLLKDILSRHYVPSFKGLSRGRNVLLRRLNQLSRILASTSAYLHDASVKGIINSGSASGGSRIAPDDFNILLKAVVQCQGPVDGKSLYEKWCIPPKPLYTLTEESESTPDPYLPFGVDETEDGVACVPAAAINVQTIIQPIIERMRSSMSMSGTIHERTDTESVAMKVLGMAPRPLTHYDATVDESDNDGNMPIGTTQLEHRNKEFGRAGLVIRGNIPLKPLDYSLLEWAKNTLLDLEWKPEDIVREYPEVYLIREVEEWRLRVSDETDAMP